MAQGGGKYADGVYNRRPWVAPTEAAMPPQEYLGPFQSNAERLVNQSLASLSMTGAEIQEYVRPPLPQIQLFPARYGYTESEITVEDIVELPRRVATTQRVESDYSNTPNSQQSTSTNSLGPTI